MEEEYPQMSGVYTIVLSSTTPSQVFKTLRAQVLEVLGNFDEDYYDRLLENINILFESNDTIVSLHWFGDIADSDPHVQQFALKLQEEYAPSSQITATTYVENPDGSTHSNTGVLLSEDFVISD